jgi:hypothetical protein
VSKETYYSVKRDLRIEPLSQDHSVTFNPFFLSNPGRKHVVHTDKHSLKITIRRGRKQPPAPAGVARCVLGRDLFSEEPTALLLHSVQIEPRALSNFPKCCAANRRCAKLCGSGALFLILSLSLSLSSLSLSSLSLSLSPLSLSLSLSFSLYRVEETRRVKRDLVSKETCQKRPTTMSVRSEMLAKGSTHTHTLSLSLSLSLTLDWILEDDDDGVTAQEHLTDEAIFVDGFPLCLPLSVCKCVCVCHECVRVRACMCVRGRSGAKGVCLAERTVPSSPCNACVCVCMCVRARRG